MLTLCVCVVALSLPVVLTTASDSSDVGLLEAEIESLTTERTRLQKELKSVEDKLTEKKELLASAKIVQRATEVEMKASTGGGGRSATGAGTASASRPKSAVRVDEKDGKTGGSASPAAVATTATGTATQSKPTTITAAPPTATATPAPITIPVTATTTATTATTGGTTESTTNPNPNVDKIAFIADSLGVSPYMAEMTLKENGYDVPKTMDTLLTKIQIAEAEEFDDQYPALSTDGLPVILPPSTATTPGPTTATTTTATAAPKPLLPQLSSTAHHNHNKSGRQSPPVSNKQQTHQTSASASDSSDFSWFGADDDWLALRASVGRKNSIREWKNNSAAAAATAGGGGGRVSPPVGAAGPISHATKLDMAQELKFESLKATFGTGGSAAGSGGGDGADDDTIRAVFEFMNFNYDKTASRLTEMLGQRLGSGATGSVADTTKDLIPFKQISSSGSGSGSGGASSPTDDSDEKSSVSAETAQRIDEILTQMLSPVSEKDSPKKTVTQGMCECFCFCVCVCLFFFCWWWV